MEGITWWDQGGKLVSAHGNLVITHSENSIAVYDVSVEPNRTVAYNCSSVDHAQEVAEQYWLGQA